MPDQPSAAFDPRGTYVHLPDGGGAVTVPLTERLWPALMAGELKLEGRLLTAFHFTEDTPHWEMHPAGEELLVLLNGAADLVLELPDGPTVLRLRADACCAVVPSGVWHRVVVRKPGDLVFITPGEGTRHRPVSPEDRESFEGLAEEG